MSQISKKFAGIAFLLTTLIGVPALYAADDTQNNSSSILLMASEITFQPVPGFPKGAQIVLIRGD
jgi:hypothetical protein